MAAEPPAASLALILRSLHPTLLAGQPRPGEGAPADSLEGLNVDHVVVAALKDEQVEDQGPRQAACAGPGSVRRVRGQAEDSGYGVPGLAGMPPEQDGMACRQVVDGQLEERAKNARGKFDMQSPEQSLSRAGLYPLSPEQSLSRAGLYPLSHA